jgi:hypothetical protein
MTRKKRSPDPPADLPIPVQHVIQIWKASGKLCFRSDPPQAGLGYTKVASVDLGRRFHHHVPSDGKGPSGLVIEELDNKEPWTPSKVLTGARLGWFGFKLEAS